MSADEWGARAMVRRNVYGRSALVTSLIALTMIPMAALAQAPDANGGALDEVVVTAQKRAENLQDVPISVQAFDSKTIASRQIVDAATLSNSVPGLNVTRAAFATDVFLRGVGNFTATPGVEGAVAIYVDDVYHPSAVGSTFSYNNVANIEVDKGPQGTLFGRNAAGGVIQVFTRDPKAAPELDVSAGYGNFNTTVRRPQARRPCPSPAQGSFA
jgi:iron complex outermembrane receptor protein